MLSSMSHNHQQQQQSNMMLEVKSKYDAEFRRFGLNRQSMSKFDEFYQLIERLHGLNGIQFIICYTDKDGDLLPINNDNNLGRVLNVTPGLLRLIIQRKGECYPLSSYQDYHNSSYSHHHNNNNTSTNGGNTSYRATNLINQIKNLKDLSSTLNHNHHAKSPFFISYPEDFRPVSAIIDVDILPDTYRRVRLHKHKSSKPLGFYIRDGRSLRVTPQGVEQVPGIFISRLMPGGLAESTGLLSVNDEVIEVNGIEVHGKTLDQVTDMMVANSSNLIITVKPTNQRYNLNRSANISSHSNTSSLANTNPKQQITSSSSFNAKKYMNGNSNNNNNNSNNNNSGSNIRSSIKTSNSTSAASSASSVQKQANQQQQKAATNNLSQKPNESTTSSRSSSSFSSSNKPTLAHTSNQLAKKTVETDSDDDDDEEILDQQHDHSSSSFKQQQHTHIDVMASTGSIGVIINNSASNHACQSSAENSPNNQRNNDELNNSSSDHDNSDDKILTL